MMETIKAVDDWQLDVLGVPFGGPDNKDADGEFFAPETKYHEDKYGLPPVVYYHGYDQDGRPAGEPAYIGKAISREQRADGVWYRVVLDKASELAKRVWDAARAGLARASSGSVAHLVRKQPDGRITEWPVAELSVFDAEGERQPANRYAVALPVAKALWDTAGLQWPEAAAEGVVEATSPAAAKAADADSDTPSDSKEPDMEAQEVAKIVADALAARDAEAKAKADAEAEEKARVEEAVKAAKAEWDAEAAKANRLPGGGRYDVPNINVIDEDPKFANASAADIAVMVNVLNGAGRPVSEGARKAMAYRLTSEEEQRRESGKLALRELAAAMKMAPYAIKANEIERSTLSNYGDQWAGVLYSSNIWEAIRHESVVVSKIPSIEVPQGMESMYIPLESTDPTFYLVAQAVSLPTTEATGWPNATITSSQVGTPNNKSLTVSKLGCRVLWTGEMAEDSMVPWLPQLRYQLEKAGQEQLEHVIIDGDTATGATTNINDIGGTPGGTEAFLAVDGFRKLALVTNSANCRDAGTLTVEDYLETVKLMGAAGKNADPQKVSFIVDPNTWWKTMELDEFKTKDVHNTPTLERGIVPSPWGYPIQRSFSMHWGSRGYSGYEYKAQSADGKIDENTTTDNVDGAILAVRWDQWLLGWKRRMTTEVTRIARADTSEIVMLLRLGLIYRDTEAAAESYGVTL